MKEQNIQTLKKIFDTIIEKQELDPYRLIFKKEGLRWFLSDSFQNIMIKNDKMCKLLEKFNSEVVVVEFDETGKMRISVLKPVISEFD